MLSAEADERRNGSPADEKGQRLPVETYTCRDPPLPSPKTQHFLRGCQRGTQLTNRSEESPGASARPEKENWLPGHFFLPGKKTTVFTPFTRVYIAPSDPVSG